MKRRALLAAAAIVSAGKAVARVPRDSRTPGESGGANTMSAAFYPTTNVMGGDYIFISLRWTGSAPASIASATWSGGGGGGTVLSGSFAQTGRTVQVAVSTPSPGNTTSYSLGLVANNGASTTISGISVTPPVTDLVSGIYGPSTIIWDQHQPFGNGEGGPIPQLPIGTFFTRGLPGPLSVTLTDHVPRSGDAAWFSMSSKPGGYPGTLTNAFNLCPTLDLLYRNHTRPSLSVDVNITNGIKTLTRTVTILQPAGPGIAIFAYTNLYGGSYYTPYFDTAMVLDSAMPDSRATNYVDVARLLSASGAAITFTPDTGGLLSFAGGGTPDGVVQILKSNLTPAHYGHITFQAQCAGGPLQTFDVWLCHRRAPVARWNPNGSIYSSTPPTTGFTGSNLIGTIEAYSDEHGLIVTSSNFLFELLSDSSGALQVWNTGEVYLTAAVPAGTIDAVVRITSQSGITQMITLSLPVLAGTTLAASNIVPRIRGSLTNFVPYANPQRNGSTSFPYGTPVTVGTFTVSGFANPIDWSNVQTALVLGPTFDNAQVPGGGDANSYAGQQGYNVPRYIVTGNGGSGAIAATNLSATNETTPQVDVLRVQLTDGLGTYCTKDIEISVAWHPGPSVTVGPGGTFSDPHTMGAAFWADFNAHGAAAKYAGVKITPLPGCPVVGSRGWTYGPGGGGSGFSNGWMPFPVAIVNDTSTKWSGTGTIRGTTLTVNSTTSGSIEAGDYFTSGVGTAAVMVLSGSGTTWTVHVGADPISTALSVGPSAMTTKTPRNFMDFANTTAGGGSQGGLIKAGYDLVIRGQELAHCTLAYGIPPGPNRNQGNANAGAVYMVANRTGNLWVENCYIHDSDVTILNGGPGNQVTVTNCVLMHSGNGNGSQHNIYIDTIAKLTFTRNQCGDTLAGHEFKTRAMQAIVTDNVFAEGPNGQGSCPINYTFNGNMLFLRNIVTKTVNDNVSRNSIYHQLNDEIDGGQGTTGNSIGWTWPYQNNVIDRCEYFNLVPRATAPFQDIVAFSSRGIQTHKINGVNGFLSDPIRNTPIPVEVTNTGFGDILYMGKELCFTANGGQAPTLGAGNHALTRFPARAVRLIDPITRTPPFRLPKQGPWGFFFGGHRTSTIGSSPGTYYMSLTVPSGSSSRTAVIGGALTAYDGNFNPLSSPIYSFNNEYKTDNTHFTFSATSNGIQLYTGGALADGLYLVTLQCVGTGWNPFSGVGAITSVTSFRVIVGLYE